MPKAKSTEWATPKVLMRSIELVFGSFDLDPCATAQSAKAVDYFTEAENGLRREWWGRVFMNPPYGRGIDQWVKKALDEVWLGHADSVICLLPARTDTKWWHLCVIPHASYIYFIPGRVTFEGASSAAPFPSAIVGFWNISK